MTLIVNFNSYIYEFTFKIDAQLEGQKTVTICFFKLSTIFSNFISEVFKLTLKENNKKMISFFILL